ncbi:MAG: WD40 repeat domain-containing protein, partial [Myxococcales bacterium]|nr:WD40 repeat domain-containing protein [Myxococcales bacterium]
VWRADGTGDPEVRLHEGMLDGIAVAPDRRAFVALGAPTARLWAVGPDGSMSERGAFVGDPDTRTVAAAFSADGELLAVTDRAGGVWLWEVASGRLRERLGSHDARPEAVVFDDAGRRLLTGDVDGMLRMWSLDGASRKRERRLRGMIQAIALGVDGQLLLAADDEALVGAPDLSTTIALRGHRAAIEDAALDPSGREFATASDDGTVRRWDARSGAEIGRLDHPDAVNQVAYSPDGRWLVTAAGAQVRLWRRDDPHVVHTLRGHEASVDVLSFSRDGARLLTASMDKSVRVWRVDALIETRLYRPPGKGLQEAFGGCDVGRVAALADEGLLWVWACGEPGPPREVRLSPHHVNELELDAGLTRGVYADEEGVWEIDLADLRKRRIGVHPRRGWRVARSPDGRRLVSTGYDRTARVWDLEGAAPPIVLAGHTAPVVWDAAWSPDGGTIATIGNDTSVRIWSIGHALESTSGGPVEIAADRVFEGHARGAKTVAFDPTGRWVLTSSPDASARLWDPRGAAPPVVFAGHRGMIYDAAWSPDGTRVATASEDGTARIWRVDAPERPQVLRGHRGEVGTVAWSADGRSLVTGSSEGIVRVWSAEEGLTTDILEVGGDVLSARFISDDAELLIAAEDDAVRVWRPTRDAAIDTAALLSRLRAATTACLTPREREMILAEDEAEAWARHG